MRPECITKELSANDTGITGTHQAGILVPKDPFILGFFPTLDKAKKNPRHAIIFHETSGECWEFRFIYYNNKFFGGTRNEYRLTCMTEYLRNHNLKPGDELILSRERDSRYVVNFKRKNAPVLNGDKLRLGSSWKVLNL
jgi:hypothetical protein